MDQESDRAPDTSESTKNVRELCFEIFSLIIKIKHTANPADPQQLQKIIPQKSLTFPQDIEQNSLPGLWFFLKHTLDKFEENCKDTGIDSADIELVLYALIALIDEILFLSADRCAQFWLSRPLQIEYFETLVAGEKFYHNLSQLRNDPVKNFELLEIYYFCLTLGFKGKYVDYPHEREEVIQDLAETIKDLRKQVVNVPQEKRYIGTWTRKRSYSVSFLKIFGVGFALMIIMWLMMVYSTRNTSMKLIDSLSSNSIHVSEP